MFGDEELDIVLAASEEGPLQHQRETAAFLRGRFEELTDAARAFVQPPPEGLLEVESIGFEPEEGVWEVVLVTDADSRYYCVRMHRDVPQAVRVDG